MAKFWLCAAVGFYMLQQICAARMDLNISCRYAGVFHVEKNQRYSLTREEAVQLCEALNSTIPTWDQMEKAYTLGFETCRYGYIEDKIVLPRHTPYFLCAANNTGIYILSSNFSDRYDAYCFNSSESRDVVCEPVKKLYSALPDNNSSVEIFNADGSRYVEGKKVTERPQVTEDDSSVGSGSAIGRGTTDPSDFIPEDDITTFTAVYGSEDPHYHHPGNPSEDQNPTEENSNHGKHHGNSSQDQQITEDFPLWWPPEEPKGMQNTTSSEDQSFEDDDDGGGDDDEEGSGQKNPETVLEWDNSGDKELQSSNTTVNSSRDVKQEESTHGILLPAVHSGRDSEVRYSTNDTRVDVLPGIVPLGDDEQYSTTTAMSSSDDFFKQEDSKQPQLASAFPEVEIEDTISPAINTSDMLHPEFSISDENENTLEKDPFHHPGPDPNKHPSVAGDKNMTPLPEGSGKSQPRMARIPDWLIVVASLLALALILGVCIAVNSRRRCGQKKKLVINNGKGGIDEKKKDGLNGEASKSQEMVHLVHKEKPEDQKGPHDEFQAIDETQNQQDVPLKSGM